MTNGSARRMSVKAVCMTVAVFTAVAVTAGAAWAAFTDNMYPTPYANLACVDEGSTPNGYLSCQTDNATLTYYMDSGGSNMLETVDRNRVNYVMEHVFEPTDLTVSLDSTPSFSGSAETDIVYEESGIGVPSGASGVTFCNDAADHLRCDQQYIRILGGGHYANGLICHETGHAVGLLHGDQASPVTSRRDERLGCMEDPVSDGEVLQDNNIDNINGTY
ncbi:hypothetical protein [Glycomyces artemisiae]|uniref:hypothetical protein n=1 Tax=Glycomyces artemisiae TaxID=1076443 RepID=UPI001C63417D|nr:hypothetical protein [Glycomyces artemisiae]